MANKQITELPPTTTFGPEDVFHVVGGGTNKHINGNNLVTEISSKILSDASLSAKGVVQLNDSVISSSTTQAATPNAVRQVNSKIEGLSVTLGSAAFTDTSEYATSAQGSLANTAVQPSSIGTVASRQVVTNNVDITSTRIPQVGWMGQGVSLPLTTSDNVLTLPYIGPNTNLIYSWPESTIPSGLPVAQAGALYRTLHQSGYETLMFCPVQSNNRYINTKNSTVWSGWSSLLGGGSSGIPEAPVDGQLYGRKDSSWEPVTGSTSSDTFTNSILLPDITTVWGIEVLLDCSVANIFHITFPTDVLPGTVIFNLQNLPLAVNNFGFRGSVFVLNSGARAVNFSAAGFTSQWLYRPWDSTQNQGLPSQAALGSAAPFQLGRIARFDFEIYPNASDLLYLDYRMVIR